jgi:peptide/nickel transport system ATP-binding protein
MSVPLIETRDLTKYFKTARGSLHAVDGVNLSIGRGETLGVVGESGCGKSTLGRVILRLIEPSSGEIRYKGEDLLKLSNARMNEYRKDMQIIFQDPYSSLNPRLTVSEIIAEPMKVRHVLGTKAERDEKINDLMATVGLDARYVNTYPHELDGGRRQRIGVARALVLDPQFIVCDEPVSALDVSIQAQILNLMMDLQEQRGYTYMFITHDLSVVKHISTNILVMYLGKMVEMAPSRDLFKNPLHPYTQGLLEAIPVPNLSNRGKARKILAGEVVSPINPRPGCRFAGRCSLAAPACTGGDIPLQEASPGHFVACSHL